MSPLALSGFIFALVLSGILIGHALPGQRLNKESQDAVRLSVGFIATMAALVLSLLIASAKSTFDTQSGQVKRITSDLILLDNLLAQYGPEATPIRSLMRNVVPAFADRIWREKTTNAGEPFEASANAEALLMKLQTLSPQNDLQRSLQAQAIQASNDLTQTRLLLFAETDTGIPVPFLIVLVFWLIIIFASFSLFATLNATVFIILSVLALSASGAIFLILELGEPFTGLLIIPSEPLRDALGPLSQ
jgi:hypothetical protein